MSKRTKIPVQYWAYTGNETEALRNGSFLRKSKYGLARFMNGDFMGFIESEVVPEGFTEVPKERADELIPDCCR